MNIFTTSHRTQVVFRRAFRAMTACGVAGGILTFLAVPSFADTTTSGSTATKPTDELITAAQALKAGFGNVVQPAGVSTSTGVTGCPNAAEEAFANKTATIGLVSEAYFCTSASAANTLMSGVKRSGTSVAGVAVPTALGSGAMARKSGGSHYGIFWKHLNVVEIAAVDTGLKSSSKGSVTQPFTPALQGVLVTTAKEQNMRFVTPPADASSSAQAAADSAAAASGCPADPTTALHKAKWRQAPSQTISSHATYAATVKTDAGTFVLSLDPTQAPITVNNFVFLARHGFFDCVTFHRVIPGFVDQTGDPTGTGTGGPGYTIADEYPPKGSDSSQQYPLGSVAMANTGKAHTGGSQWFVVTGSQGESLAPSYSLFGQVTSGMDVVQTINNDGSSSGAPSVVHRILTVTITTSSA